MNATHILFSGNLTVAVIGTDAHVLRRSSSRFHIDFGMGPKQYLCLGACCDFGVQPDVEALVKTAKVLGAKRVIIRTSARSDLYCPEIAGLVVSDVTKHVGSPAEGVHISG